MDGLLEISTLGGLSIQYDGKPFTALVTHKVEALLVYLACTGRAHPRDVLAELLWEERSQAQALSNLRVALSNLRKCLPNHLDIRRDVVGIHPNARLLLDVAELEGDPTLLTNHSGHQNRLSQAAISQLEQSVALYQGDFLAGFPIRSCPGFENWMTFQQERVRLVFERKISTLIDALLAENRWLDVIKWGEYWIAYSYHPEHAYRALMTAFCGLGDRASMSATYQRCLTAFREELGIDPSEQTRKLYEILLRGEMPAKPALVQPGETRESPASTSARLILDQCRNRDGKPLDIASLAVMYASCDDLDIGTAEAALLTHSALHHGLDIQPWIRRLSSGEEAVEVLASSYQAYPKPKIRLKIVDTLKEVENEAAADLLYQIGVKDDAPDVRAEAAAAAAARGWHTEVVKTLLTDLQTSSDAAALAALVAVIEEAGLPQGIRSYPKLPIALALGRKRWQANRDLIRSQVMRGTFGGVLSGAFFGCLLPVFVYWANPAAFKENLLFISLVAWVLSGAIAGLVIGSLLGAAISFAVSLADALFRGKRQKRWRFALAGSAGLAYSIYLVTFSLAGLLMPEVIFWVYFLVYILYGFLFGMAISLVFPPLGKRRPASQQLLRALSTAAVMVTIALPAIFLVYPQTWAFRYAQEACFLVIFTLGMSLAVNRSRAEFDQGGSIA